MHQRSQQMNDSTTAVKNPSQLPPTVASSAKKIGFVCVLLVMVRIYLSWVGKQSFAAEDFSWPVTWTTAFAAVVAAIISATLARRWFGKLISYLTAIVCGAIASVHLASPFGAIIGGFVGIFVVFDHPRTFCRMALRWFVRIGLWMFAVGGLAGCLFVNSVTVQDRSIFAASILGGLSLCLLAAAVLCFLKSSADGSTTQRLFMVICNSLAAFLIMIFGWLLGIEATNQYCYRQLDSVGGVGSEVADPSRWITHGITFGSYVQIGRSATNDSMRILQRTPDITGLTIYSELVNDQGLQFVSNNRLVKWMSIQEASLTDGAFSALAPLRAMESLGLDGLPIGDQAIESMGAKPFLSNLRLRKTLVGDRGMKSIGRFSRLRALSLVGTRITDKGLAELVSPTLTDIDVSQTQIRGPGLEYLAKLRSLRRLNLSHTNLETQYIELLKVSPSLSGLYLDGIKLDEQAVDALRMIPTLKSLSIAETEITDKQAKRLPRLIALTIDSAHLTPSTIELFTKNQTDVDLRLDDRLLTPEWIERASRFGLEIYCSNCLIDLPAIEALEKHADKIKLNLRFLQIKDEHYYRLKQTFGTAIVSRDKSWKNVAPQTSSE